MGTLIQESKEPVFHDRFVNRLRFQGHLVCRTGLHIGAGGSRDFLGTDQPVVRDAMGRPIVPGASLKGILRSAAESLLRTFDRPKDDAAERPPLWTCDLVGGQPCVDDQRIKALRLKLPTDPTVDDQRTFVESVWEESCTVCRLFGSMALASRVRFPDLPAVEVPRFEVRNGVGIDRDKELAAEGVLYDFEAVPPGTTFELTVLGDNVKDFEVGLILYLFDELHRGQLSLGGKTSRGLGQMAVEWSSVEETTLGAGGSNPFADLLRRNQLLDEEEDEAVEALPLPADGDQALWGRLADALDAFPTVDEAVLGDVIQKHELGNKAQLNDTLALGLARPRQYRKVILDQLTECGRLVERDGALVPFVAAREADHDGADLDRRLHPIYKRFVGAMDALWQEVA